MPPSALPDGDAPPADGRLPQAALAEVGRRTFARICDTGRIDVLVTDDSAPADALERLREVGVQIVVA